MFSLNSSGFKITTRDIFDAKGKKKKNSSPVVVRLVFPKWLIKIILWGRGGYPYVRPNYFVYIIILPNNIPRDSATFCSV